MTPKSKLFSRPEDASVPAIPSATPIAAIAKPWRRTRRSNVRRRRLRRDRPTQLQRRLRRGRGLRVMHSRLQSRVHSRLRNRLNRLANN